MVEQSTIDERRRAHRHWPGWLNWRPGSSSERFRFRAGATIGPDEPVACMLEEAARRRDAEAIP